MENEEDILKSKTIQLEQKEKEIEQVSHEHWGLENGEKHVVTMEPLVTRSPNF